MQVLYGTPYRHMRRLKKAVEKQSLPSSRVSAHSDHCTIRGGGGGGSLLGPSTRLHPAPLLAFGQI